MANSTHRKPSSSSSSSRPPPPSSSSSSSSSPPVSAAATAAAAAAAAVPPPPVVEQVEGLSAYDMVREPRRVVDDPDMVQDVAVQRLMEEFKCPICLGVLTNTVTVTQCLHRFCAGCMERNLRSMSKKQCPACRIHVPSRRSLQRDYRVDALIAKIIPDIARFERKRLRRMKKATADRTETAGVNKTWSMILEQQKAFRQQTGMRSPAAVVQEQLEAAEASRQAASSAASVAAAKAAAKAHASAKRRNAGGSRGKGGRSKHARRGTSSSSSSSSTKKKSASASKSQQPPQRAKSSARRRLERVVLAKHPLSTMKPFAPTALMVEPDCTVEVLKTFLASHVFPTKARLRDFELTLLAAPSNAVVLQYSTAVSSLRAMCKRRTPIIVHVCVSDELG